MLFTMVLEVGVNFYMIFTMVLEVGVIFNMLFVMVLVVGVHFLHVICDGFGGRGSF